jgi:hypothetical protein
LSAADIIGLVLYTVYRPDERPEVEVLVDATWHYATT